MTTDRVYRRKLTTEDALLELHRCSGTQFDPDVVAAFSEEFGYGAPLAVASLAS
jgi:HD-GYP domain-containing protein (c-di-GMP phosphodiesterase class II)